MTNAESKQQYEGAILQQLIKNSERLVVVEQDTSQLKEDLSQLKQDMAYVKPKVENIDKTLGVIKWILVTIALSIIANIFSEQINAWLF
ncbi:conserved hypothetical protein [Hyella patelloides LEGE 07179]|uniref:Uncharacterized protein n=1 Tax=Hyella patelloides LEGE 07179 TaxID=945734 RepID=A0A563W2W8_9CYAN|nr:hypothetical protein [Hyella patelloides]VEP18042.1 conserved hypothetical protein [Hyella patelloides LEGE 07179]